MLFWIIVVLGIIIPIIFGILDGYAPVVITIGGWLSSAVIILIATILLVSFTGIKQEQETVDLRAIGTDSKIEGRSYFLTGGYVNEYRVLNYIAQEDGYSYLGQAKAYDSKIFEQENLPQPYVDITYTVHENQWLTPFKVYHGAKYKFYVPNDSIVEDYQINN